MSPTKENNNQEIFLVKTLLVSRNFSEVLDSLNRYDKETVSNKFFDGTKSSKMRRKKTMETCFRLFKSAQSKVTPKGSTPSFGDAQFLRNLYDEFRRKLPAVARLSHWQYQDDTGALMFKYRIGQQFLFSVDAAVNGVVKLNEDLAYRARPAMTERSGRVRYGCYDQGKVFDTRKRPYKTTGQILQERISAEGRA